MHRAHPSVRPSDGEEAARRCCWPVRTRIHTYIYHAPCLAGLLACLLLPWPLLSPSLAVRRAAMGGGKQHSCMHQDT